MTTITAPRPDVKPGSRKPRPKPARFARLVGDFRRDFAGVLTLTVGDASTDYTLERLDLEPDFGSEAYRFTKHVGHPAAECDVYHVTLSDQGHACECMGFLRHGHCKHCSALVALRTHGKI